MFLISTFTCKKKQFPKNLYTINYFTPVEYIDWSIVEHASSDFKPSMSLLSPQSHIPFACTVYTVCIFFIPFHTNTAIQFIKCRGQTHICILPYPIYRFGPVLFPLEPRASFNVVECDFLKKSHGSRKELLVCVIVIVPLFRQFEGVFGLVLIVYSYNTMFIIIHFNM